MTCLSRACSAMERNHYYRSGDHVAPSLLPAGLRILLHLSPARWFFSKMLAPRGIYEYVVARTKYIDAAFKQALEDRFDQVLIFGAGFDTRALRLQDAAGSTRVFELDVPVTQQAKLGQYRKRHLAVPPCLTFVAVDFDKESIPMKIDQAGFSRKTQSLFILEGLLMYLQPKSVDEIFQTIRDYAGRDSRVVFDYIYASILRKRRLYHGEDEIAKMVSRANEPWHFGIEKGRVQEFLAGYSMRLTDHRDANALQQAYFKTPSGETIGRVNGTHCLVTAETC